MQESEANEHPPDVRSIDITDIAGTLQFITIVNPILVFGGLLIPTTLLANALRERPLTTSRFDLLVVLALVFAAIIAWRNRNGINALRQNWTLASLALAAALATFQAGANLDLFLLWPCLHLGAAAIAVVTLRRALVPTSDIRLPQIARHGPPEESYLQSGARPRRPIAGAVLLVLGLCLFAAGTTLQFLGAELLLPLLGTAVLLISRACFEPGADDVLSRDPRPPVVFLRAFADDESIDPLDIRRSLIDFSVEDRLAAHFTAFGPFIAIGDPKKKRMVIGASRAFVSDAEWQERVRDWIARANVILWSAGGTRWVYWELEQVIAAGGAERLIIVFPRKARDAAERLRQLSAVFEATPWKAALAKIENAAALRALQFGPGGALTAITSATTGRSAQHIAVLIAHLFMHKRPPIIEPSVTDARRAAAGAKLEIASIQLCVLSIIVGALAVAWASTLTIVDAAALKHDPPWLGALVVLGLAPPAVGVIGFILRGRRRADLSLGLLFGFGWLFFFAGTAAQFLRALGLLG